MLSRSRCTAGSGCARTVALLASTFNLVELHYNLFYCFNRLFNFSRRYRHALPPGYVFKSKKDRELEKGNKVMEISIEEIIEQQRAKLGPNGGTPVTEETLAKWKADKQARKKAEETKRLKEQAKRTGGRGISTFMIGLIIFNTVPSFLIFISTRFCCSEWSCAVHIRPDLVPR